MEQQEEKREKLMEQFLKNHQIWKAPEPPSCLILMALDLRMVEWTFATSIKITNTIRIHELNVPGVP